MSTDAKIFRISISSKKGDKKSNVEEAELREDFGILGDAHAGSERQVSLLPFESFGKMRTADLDVQPGEFAENITTVGLTLHDFQIGERLMVGGDVELIVTHIGKKCHHGCYIRERVGDCIMPREGIFARVARGGRIRVGDRLVREGSHV